MNYDEKLILRMKKIKGQVNGLVSMLEQDRDCTDVLIQISAVTSALSQVGKKILEGHIENCFVKDVKEGRETEAILKLEEVLEKFVKLK